MVIFLCVGLVVFNVVPHCKDYEEEEEEEVHTYRGTATRRVGGTCDAGRLHAHAHSASASQ